MIACRRKVRISIVSHSLPHIKRGAFRDFQEIMINWGLWDERQFSYTEFVYYFKNGSYIELFGLEDEGKARGPSRDILFINEANLIKKSLYDQLAIRTTEQIILDLNPAEVDSWCYAIADDAENKKIHSTYLDNSYWDGEKMCSYLSVFQRKMVEAYKDADPMMWEVYGLGLRGKSTITIYTHWKLCQQLPLKGELFAGQDFGYAVPAATVRCEYYEGAIYAEELIYKEHLTNPKLIEYYQSVSMSKTIEIFCDNAEPKSIEDICNYGYNAKPAEKDVWAGIQKVKSMPLYITENSVNLLREIKNYKWKTDKDDKILPDEVPVKVDDHALDALRYAVFTKFSGLQYTWTVLE
jgi:phage terminase large subunit